jgi:hypothetical protein
MTSTFSPLDCIASFEPSATAGKLHPGAGGQPLALSPDERAEEGLLQLRVEEARIRGPHLSGG